MNGAALGYPYRTDITPGTFRPGAVWADYYVEGGGYWGDGVTAKQHHQQYEEYLTSFHNAAGMTCTSCHNAHGSANEHDLTKPARGMANGTLCYDCHQTRQFPNDNDADRTAPARS